MSKSEAKPWLNKWRVLEPVGTGGQGTAEFCIPLASGGDSQRYVLKRLKRQNDPERRARMHREVSALRTLRHVGLPVYVDGNTEQFSIAETPLYFVMDYVRGSTLEAVVVREPLSLASALGLTLGLVDIVDHCHKNGVIHRDIKPDNIVLRNDDVTKPVLIDFGLTFNRDDPAVHETEESQHLGNRFLYLPELRGSAQEKRDARSDLTACCGILYYALTGESPTSLEDSTGAKPHQRASARRTWATFSTPVMTALNSIFDQAFQTPIGLRWQSSDGLRQALQHATTSDASPPPPIGDPMDRLARIRAKVQARPEHAHELRMNEVLQSVDAEVRKAQQAVASSLGGDFSWSQGSYALDVARGVVGNTLAIGRVNNPTEWVSPRFEGHVTGTELVVTATKEGQQTVLLRTPMEAPIPANELQRSVIVYFTSELEKILP